MFVLRILSLVASYEVWNTINWYVHHHDKVQIIVVSSTEGFCFHDTTAPAGPMTFFDHTQTHHGRYDSSGPVIGPWRRPLPDIARHSQQTLTRLAGFEPAITASERTQTNALDGGPPGPAKLNLFLSNFQYSPANRNFTNIILNLYPYSAHKMSSTSWALLIAGNCLPHPLTTHQLIPTLVLPHHWFVDLRSAIRPRDFPNKNVHKFMPHDFSFILYIQLITLLQASLPSRQ